MRAYSRSLALTLCTLVIACNVPTKSKSETHVLVPRSGYTANNAELLPHIQETHLEMRENYREAVDLLDRMRRVPELAEEYALLEKYVESLNQDLTAMDALEVIAKQRTLTQQEADDYRQRRGDWRARSTVVFSAVGQSFIE